MYKITKEQLEQVLQVVYQTNIPVSAFDAIKKLLSTLPEIKEEEVKEEKK